MTGGAQKVLAIGALPPPMNGMTVMTVSALDALRSSQGIDVIHLDTSDHRAVGNVERFDFQNVYLALKHGAQGFMAMAACRPSLVYLPIAQGTLGFLRDTQFFVAARMFGARTLIHFHGGEFSVFYRGSNRVMRWLIRWCMRTCVGAIVLGRSAAEDVGNVLELPHVVRLPNGVPPVSDLPVFERTPGEVRVLFVSNLMERKGYLDLLAAVEKVTAEQPAAKFIVAGSETAHSKTPAAEAAIQRALATGRVMFTGDVTGLRKTELFRTADIFVFPPNRPEGHPIVLLEAMSAGLPVVATDVGGMRETVQDGISGLLVPPNAADKLAKAILALIADPELRRDLGVAGRRRFVEQFSTGSFSRRLSATIQDTLGRLSVSEVAA